MHIIERLFFDKVILDMLQNRASRMQLSYPFLSKALTAQTYCKVRVSFHL